jgi:hypothetical protein
MITCALASRGFKLYAVIHVFHHFPSIKRTEALLVRQMQPIQPLISSEIPIVILNWPESQRLPLRSHRHLDRTLLEQWRNINLVI